MKAQVVSVASSANIFKISHNCRKHVLGREVELQAAPETLLGHITAPWDIDVLFGSGKVEISLPEKENLNDFPTDFGKFNNYKLTNLWLNI